KYIGLHKLCKSIVRHCFRKLSLHMFLNIENVKVLKASKTAQMKKNHNTDYFTGSHHWGSSFRFVSNTVFFNKRKKLLAKFINKTKNLLTIFYSISEFVMCFAVL